MIANRTRRKILLILAAALLAGATVFAQMQPGGMGQQPPMPGQQPVSSRARNLANRS